MTTFDKVNPAENQLEISWTPPTFLPEYYRLTTSCKLLCDHSTYYLTQTLSDRMDTSSTIHALFPGSTCMIKLVASYNPASIDPGIGLSAHTLLSSKCTVLCETFTLNFSLYKYYGI